MQIRSRSNFAKILGQFGKMVAKTAVKPCLFCGQPSKVRRRVSKEERYERLTVGLRTR